MENVDLDAFDFNAVEETLAQRAEDELSLQPTEASNDCSSGACAI